MDIYKNYSQKEKRKKKEERERNEVRDQWGSGSQDPGTHSPKYLRKQTESWLTRGGHPEPSAWVPVRDTA